MSRGVIAENLGDGRYSVTIECDRTTGENQIDDINRQLDDLTSMESIDSELLGTWADANSTALSTAAGYQTALGHNIETWEQTQQITNEINYLNIEISLLEQQVSDAKRALDEAEREMLDAFTAYNNEEITWEEYQATVKVYQDYAANWSSLDNSLSALKSDHDDLVEEKAELTITDTNALLESLSASMEQLLEITEEQSIPMYEDHADYAVPIVGTIVGLTDATIQFYSDVVNKNQEHAERSLEIQEEMSAINMDIHDLETDLAVKAHTKDQSIAAYEDALDLYWAGEMSWVELQQFELAASSAISAYNQVESELQWKHEDMVELQQEALTLTQVNPNPIMDDITSLTEMGLYASQQRDKINMNLEALKLQKTALEKRRYEIQHILDTQDRTETIWCADYSGWIEVGAVVGLIEIAGLPANDPRQIIYPADNGESGYNNVRDGWIENVKIQTAAQAVYNWAMLPGWQKWVSRYRLATITAMHEDDTCDLTMDACQSPARNINVNQSGALNNVPIKYMMCDSTVFAVGDRVVVMFESGDTGLADWKHPKVIGFKEHPKPCPNYLFIHFEFEGHEPLLIVWDVEKNAPLNVKDPVSGDPVQWPCETASVTWLFERYDKVTSRSVASHIYEAGSSVTYGYYVPDYTSVIMEILASDQTESECCPRSITPNIISSQYTSVESLVPVYIDSRGDERKIQISTLEERTCDEYNLRNTSTIPGDPPVGLYGCVESLYYHREAATPGHTGLMSNNKYMLYGYAYDDYVFFPWKNFTTVYLPNIFISYTMKLRDEFVANGYAVDSAMLIECDCVYDSNNYDITEFPFGQYGGPRISADGLPLFDESSIPTWDDVSYRFYCNTPLGVYDIFTLNDSKYELPDVQHFFDYGMAVDRLADGYTNQSFICNSRMVAQFYSFEHVIFHLSERHYKVNPDEVFYDIHVEQATAERVVSVYAAAAIADSDYGIDPNNMTVNTELSEMMKQTIENFYFTAGIRPEDLSLPNVIRFELRG